jgi:hypothetical protein
VARQCLRVEGTRRLVAIAAIPAVLLLDWGLGLDRSKPHMLACIEWMRATLAPGTHLFTNDKQLAAASGLHWEWDEVRDVNLVFAEGRAPFGADWRGNPPGSCPSRSSRARRATGSCCCVRCQMPLSPERKAQKIVCFSSPFCSTRSTTCCSRLFARRQ